MWRIRERLTRFMYGRYGNDKLGYLLIIIYFILWFINIFLRSIIVSLLSVGIIVYWVFRAFSKNIFARQKENAFVCNILAKIKSFFVLQYNRIHDIKKYRYRKCKNCKAVLRLPIKKGKNIAVCPKCGNRCRVNIVF